MPITAIALAVQYKVRVRTLSLNLLILLCTAAATAAWAETYKWVDENGVVHYGDYVPKEHVRRERFLLNEHGVTVGVMERAKSPEELEAEALALREAERRRRELLAQQERDRVLLETYLSVNEIEELRDRRILAIEAQIGLTRHYLDNLQTKWRELEEDASRYNFPFSPDSDLPPLPEDLAEHIVFTENAMSEHMTTLRTLRREQSQIRDKFREEIERFRRLKEEKDSQLASKTP